MPHNHLFLHSPQHAISDTHTHTHTPATVCTVHRGENCQECLSNIRRNITDTNMACALHHPRGQKEILSTQNNRTFSASVMFPVSVQQHFSDTACRCGSATSYPQIRKKKSANVIKSIFTDKSPSSCPFPSTLPPTIQTGFRLVAPSICIL